MQTKTLAIALMIIAPLVWGLGVEWIFELRRRMRGKGTLAPAALDGEEEEAIVR